MQRDQKILRIIQRNSVINSDNTEHKKIRKGPRTNTGAFVKKRVHKLRNRGRRQRRKELRIVSIAFLIVAIIAVVYIYHDYHERPGIIESSSLRAVERTTDSITVEWDDVRNTDTYVLYYKQKGKEFKDWTRIDKDANVAADESERHDKASATVANLEEGTEYVFVVRADNEEREGFETKGKAFKTKAKQKIKVKTHYTKLTSSKDLHLGAKAKTKLTYESSDESVVTVGKTSGTVKMKGEGIATIKITAAETADYVGASKKVKIRVIDSTPVRAGGASAFSIFHLDPSNCTAVKEVYGDGGIHVPQGIGYSGKNYYIAYGMSSSQRIIRFSKEGDDRSVSVPQISLGHPNGFCYADSTGLCYCVRGWSGRCVTYSPDTGEYGVFTLPYGASGIGYDRDKNRFYTCSRTAMVSYSGDGNFEVRKVVGVVKHSGYTYTQDCGGHAGIMMRCLSGSSKHGINYIDLYDMEGGLYLGTITCDLSEVESAFCDEDGYLMILANNSSRVDYIWKTSINIKDIADGLK